jgi:hypothetical protein
MMLGVGMIPTDPSRSSRLNLSKHPGVLNHLRKSDAKT